MWDSTNTVLSPNAARQRDNNSREKRNSKPDVPVVPMLDHRLDDEQKPRSSKEHMHPRSAVLSGVIVPLLTEVLHITVFLLKILYGLKFMTN